MTEPMKKSVEVFLYVCFSPTGRINRAWWWLYTLLTRLLVFVLYAISSEPFIVWVTASIVLLYSDISATVKRFHDTNRSGWNLLWTIIPIFGALYLLIVSGFFKGTDGENKYGAPHSSSTGTHLTTNN